MKQLRMIGSSLFSIYSSLSNLIQPIIDGIKETPLPSQTSKTKRKMSKSLRSTFKNKRRNMKRNLTRRKRDLRSSLRIKN